MVEKVLNTIVMQPNVTIKKDEREKAFDSRVIYENSYIKVKQGDSLWKIAKEISNSPLKKKGISFIYIFNELQKMYPAKYLRIDQKVVVKGFLKVEDQNKYAQLQKKNKKDDLSYGKMLRAQQAQLQIKNVESKVKEIKIENDNWSDCLCFESYHGTSTNEGGMSSIIPNDPTAFYGDGELIYHINKATYSADNYDKKIFLSFYYQNKILKQEGEGSKYKTMFNDIGGTFKFSTGKYGGNWTTTPFFSVDYSKNNTNTEVPDLGKYDSDTVTYTTGLESITLPSFSSSYFYKSIIGKTNLNFSGYLSYEKGKPDFELNTKGFSVGLSQPVLPRYGVFNLGINYSYSESSSKSKIFGGSDSGFEGIDLSIYAKPLVRFDILPDFLKNVSIDYIHSIMLADLESGTFSQKSKGEKDKLTVMTPLVNKFSKGKYYSLNAAIRYAKGKSFAGVSSSESETFAFGFNCSFGW